MATARSAPERRLRTSYRPQRVAGPCRGDARRVPADDLQPDPRRPAADHSHARRIAARAARLGAGGPQPGCGRSPSPGDCVTSTTHPRRWNDYHELQPVLARAPIPLSSAASCRVCSSRRAAPAAGGSGTTGRGSAPTSPTTCAPARSPSTSSSTATRRRWTRSPRATTCRSSGTAEERRRAARQRRPARRAAAGRRRSTISRATSGCSRRSTDDGARASAPTRSGPASDDLPRADGPRASTVAVIDSGIDTRHSALRRRVLATRGLHRRRRRGSVRPRHARGGDHRRPGGADGGHARLARHRAGRVPRQPARARRRRVGVGEQRDRGDRLGDRAPAANTTSG